MKSLLLFVIPLCLASCNSPCYTEEGELKEYVDQNQVYLERIKSLSDTITDGGLLFPFGMNDELMVHTNRKEGPQKVKVKFVKESSVADLMDQIDAGSITIDTCQNLYIQFQCRPTKFKPLIYVEDSTCIQMDKVRVISRSYGLFVQYL